MIAGLGEEFEVAGATGKASFQHNKFWPRWTRSIYIANMPYATEESHVQEYFSAFGEILAVRLPIDE